MVFKRGIEHYLRANDWVEKTIFLTAVLVSINWMIFDWAGNVFKMPQLMSFNMFWAGILFAAISRHTSTSNQLECPAPSRDRLL